MDDFSFNMVMGLNMGRRKMKCTMLNLEPSITHEFALLSPGEERLGGGRSDPLKYTDPSGYRQKPFFEWEMNYSNSGASMVFTRPDFSSLYIPGSMGYTYVGNNEYIDKASGETVGYETVFNNYILPAQNKESGNSESTDIVNLYFPRQTPVLTNKYIPGAIKWNIDGSNWYVFGFTTIYTSRTYEVGAVQGGGDYFKDPLFYINGGFGIASTGATIKGGYHLSNELYHYTRSSGNLHIRGGKYWNNPLVNNSKAALITRGGTWRAAGTKLGYAGIAVTTGDAFLSGEFRASQGINVAMTTLAIAVPGVGSIVAGLYFATDLGFTLATGRGIGDRIDAVTGGTYELYNGLY